MGAGDSLQDYPKLVFAGKETTFSANLQRQMMSRRVVGIFVPATFAGTVIGFKSSPDGVNWYEVLRINGEGPYTLTPTLSSYIPLDPRVVAGLAYLQLTSDLDETGLEVSVSTRAID